MTQDNASAAATGQERRPVRCGEIIRTDRGWERCHLDEHRPDVRHHVRDRSWLSAENTPRLRLGQPCEPTCTWPDVVIPYRRGGSGRVRQGAVRDQAGRRDA